MLLCDQQQACQQPGCHSNAMTTVPETATNNSYADFPAATSYQSELDAMNHAQHLQLHQQQIQQQSQHHLELHQVDSLFSASHGIQHHLVHQHPMQQSATWSLLPG
uniref:Antennapedia n=1 Tax=Macrostomum lignano TaxID=282301 RepID=A0A1I8I692_9PLAT